MRWDVDLTNPAERQIARLPTSVQRRVFAGLEGLKTVPRTGDIKKLAGTGSDYRLRVGDYRVFYTLERDAQVVVVTAVRHRSSAYER